MVENCQNETVENSKIIIECKLLLEKVIASESSRSLSLEIAEFFTRGIDMLPQSTLEQLIIVFFKGIENEPLYVNEIKVYLNKNNSFLYKNYGNMFLNNYGAWKVFGIGLSENACCPVIDDMIKGIEEIPLSRESRKAKKNAEEMKSIRERKKKANNERRNKRNVIRKNAKAHAIETLKKKTQMKNKDK